MYAMKCLDAALYEMDQRNYETAHVLISRFVSMNAFDEMQDKTEVAAE